MSDAIRFSSVAVNCPDATELARFCLTTIDELG